MTEYVCCRDVTCELRERHSIDEEKEHSASV